MELYLVFIAGIVLAGIALTPVAERIGAPLLLLFLGLGMLAGEDGIGGIHFENFSLAYNVGTMALAVILFSGGLDTPQALIRKVAWPSFFLSTVGVAVTAAIVGIAAAALFDLSLTVGLLLGAVVGSTDAAATFLLLRRRGVELRERVRETIMVESGINDPMAIFLTVLFVTLVDAGVTTVGWDALAKLPGLFLRLFLGGIGGILGGRLLAWMIWRISLPQGLYPPLALAGGLFVFAATQELGGSGFLAVYLCGVVMSAELKRQNQRILDFHDGLAWLAQVVMYLLLGLLVHPADLPASVAPALGLALVMIFLARPAAVFLCLAPFGYQLREKLYISWIGLKGMVPIFLAIIPVISPGPLTVDFFNTVFIIVVVSLLVQGWTIPAMARFLRVDAESADKN